MKKKLRKYLLWPLSLLYALGTEIRNLLYDYDILRATEYPIPLIIVGNLNVGGSGKTPQIEYLVRLLKDNYKVAVLSRGYKRKTKGFRVAGTQSTPQELGDEPYQIAQKFPGIIVSVSEKRAPAIEKLMKEYQADVILLDDAFQHRQIKAGMNIILTPSQEIFPLDFPLPSGNLRECKHQAKRADIVMVTKTEDKTEKEKIIKKLRKYFDKEIYFSKITYSSYIKGKEKEIEIENLKDYKILLVTGIANPSSLYQFLSKKNINFDRLKFSDHFAYTKNETKQMEKWFEEQEGNKKIVLTTEKDFVKLKDLTDLPLFYLPIQTKIENEEVFNKKILNYVDSRKFI